MEPWISLTVDGLLSTMTHRERVKFGTVSASAEVPDRVTPILVDLVAEVRGYIASHARNTLSADKTLIPSEFKAKALAMARWRLLITMPNYDPGEERKGENERAESFFLLVAKGTIRPSPAPDAVVTAVPEEQAHPKPLIRARKRRFTREQQDGI
jgi:hypothetical protein